jgi:hypothetical protein
MDGTFCGVDFALMRVGSSCIGTSSTCDDPRPGIICREEDSDRPTAGVMTSEGWPCAGTSLRVGVTGCVSSAA